MKQIAETDKSYRCLAGAICGGVVSKSLFDSNPWAYMMNYCMDDDKFKKYVAEKDKKKRKVIFDKYARIVI